MRQATFRARRFARGSRFCRSLLVLGAGALFFLGGGCPGGSSAVPDNPATEVLGIQLDLWNTSNGNPDDTSDEQGGGTNNNSADPGNTANSSDGTVSVFDETAGVMQDAPRTIVLRGASSAGRPLTFTVLTPPHAGTVSEVRAIDNASAEATYTPAAGFIGTAQFSFQATDGAATSDPGTITLLVYPEIRFAIEPLDGPRDLKIRAYAFTRTGVSLPPAQYNWAWDGTGDGTGDGSAGMGSEAAHTFSKGGLHLVTLTVTLLGLPPFKCAYGTSGTDTEGRVTVWSTISGQLRDAEGLPLTNVTVGADATNLASMTDQEGRYELTVPYDWSGTVRPLDEANAYDPAERPFVNVRTDFDSQDFGRLSANGQQDAPPQAYAQSVELNEDSFKTVQLTGFDPAGGKLLFVITGLPNEGVLLDGGYTIAYGDLPYTLQATVDLVTYVPNVNRNGTDLFAFRVTNGVRDSAPAMVGLNVLPQPDAPTIQPDGFVTLNVEQNSHWDNPNNRLDLVGNDPDSANSALTWQLSDPPHGRALFADGSQSGSGANVTIYYEPDAGHLGTDSFDVELRDSDGGITSQAITVYVGSFPIAGTARDHSNGVLKDVLVFARDTNGQITATAKTNLSGHYALLVPPGWSGTVSSNENFRLNPPSRPYTNVSAEIADQDFQAFRNWYVKPGGNDNGNGYFDAEFGTLQKAGNVVKPGDTVYVKPGVYQAPAGENKRVLKLTNLLGTQQNPITFTAYDPANPPILDGNVGTGQSVAIELLDCAWLKFSRFEIRGYKFAGIDVLATTGNPGACNNITVEYFHVHDKHVNSTSWGYAIRAKGPVHRATFRKNYVHRWSAGIALWESPEQTAVTCFVPPRAGNTAPGSPTGGYAADLPESQWDTWEGWTLIAPRWCVIEDNLCHNNTSNSGPQNADNYVTRYSIDCIVRNNVGFNDTSGVSEVIDDNYDMAGATRIQFYGNIAFNCRYLPPYPPTTGSGNGMKIGVRGALDPLVHHNVSFYNYRMGLDMGYSVRPKLYNNTIYYQSSAPEGHHKGGDYGIFFEGKSTLTGVVCVNNVVRDCNQQDIGAQNWVKLDQMDYNCISDDGSGNFFAAQGPRSKLATNPLFNNPGVTIDSNFQPGWTIEQQLEHIRSQVRQRFTPKTGSPCINAGLHVPGITDGYAGSAPDMGAFEGPWTGN